MEIIQAKHLGFCFGVKRAIKISEKNPDSQIFGSIIHNNEEIKRLENDYHITIKQSIDEIDKTKKTIIRTHGIQKQDKEELDKKEVNVIDATCPFVHKSQNIAEDMSENGYQVVIFGDEIHPEVKSVASYANSTYTIVSSLDDLKDKIKLREIKTTKKIALISQTTKQIQKFKDIASYLIELSHEVRVFNTICNATFKNQKAAVELAKEVDTIVVIGGKNSSNTKQLFEICKKHTTSYLIENEDELNRDWFKETKRCGIVAGASTPDWIIKNIIEKLEKFDF